MSETGVSEREAGSDRSVLERFVYDNVELERLETLLDAFNPFEAMRWTRQELRHSAFLRWLLDPAETHGLQDYFLRVFLKRIARDGQGQALDVPSVVDVDGWQLDDVQVMQEWNAIDVLIRGDADHFVTVVENKVDTSEHSDQLGRYRSIVERLFPDYRKLFVYLTADGDPPSDQAYLSLSHRDLAAMAEVTLERKADQLSPAVRSFVEHYVDMVRRYIVEESEIQDLCRKIYEKHRRALDLLFEHRPDRASELSDFLTSLVRGSDGLLHDSSSKSFVKFIPRELDFLPKVGEGWGSRRLLLFQFENLGGSLRLKIILGPGPAELREQIRDVIAKQRRVLNKADQKLYPKWWTFHMEKWLSEKQFEELEMEALQELVVKRFEHFKQTGLPEIVTALKELRTVEAMVGRPDA